MDEAGKGRQGAAGGAGPKMGERGVELLLVAEAKARGGKAYKFVSPGNAGVPDRLVVLPGGRLFFAELKAPGRRATALQRLRISELRRLGADVFVADGAEAVARAFAEAAGAPRPAR